MEHSARASLHERGDPDRDSNPTFEISQRCTISAQPCAILRVTSETANQPVCIAQNNALPVAEIVRKAEDAKQQFAGLVS